MSYNDGGLLCKILVHRQNIVFRAYDRRSKMQLSQRSNRYTMKDCSIATLWKFAHSTWYSAKCIFKWSSPSVTVDEL